MIKAIETRYSGYRFRSRLEARWAVYFDAIGLTWEYEKEGFDLDGVLYLPDFWLPQVSMWAEIKPVPATYEEETKAHALADASGYPVLMLIGVPDCRSYWAIQATREGWPLASDYVLSRAKLDEGRFWLSTGWENGQMDECSKEFFSDVPRAVEAARSARFEHGENG